MSFIQIYTVNSNQPTSVVINFFILNSTEHEIFPAHNVKMPIPDNCWHFNIYMQGKIAF